MSSKRQKNIPLGGPYRQVSLYLHNGIFCTGTTSLYWKEAQVVSTNMCQQGKHHQHLLVTPTINTVRFNLRWHLRPLPLNFRWQTHMKSPLRTTHLAFLWQPPKCFVATFAFWHLYLYLQSCECHTALFWNKGNTKETTMMQWEQKITRGPFY